MKTWEQEEKRHDKKKQLSHIPAEDLGLVYAPQTKPFLGSITYEHLKEYNTKERYKITYNADKSLAEIMNMIKNNELRFLDTDLKIVEDSAFKKIRQGKEDKSPPHIHKQQNKRSVSKPLN